MAWFLVSFLVSPLWFYGLVQSETIYIHERNFAGTSYSRSFMILLYSIHSIVREMHMLYLFLMSLKKIEKYTYKNYLKKTN